MAASEEDLPRSLPESMAAVGPSAAREEMKASARDSANANRKARESKVMSSPVGKLVVRNKRSVAGACRPGNRL